jgi:putative FmdB family regulatory protein
MPLYSFHCPACGKDFDRFLRLSKLKDGAACPSCSAPVAHSSSQAGQTPATAQAPNPSPGEGSCLIPQRG